MFKTRFSMKVMIGLALPASLILAAAPSVYAAQRGNPPSGNIPRGGEVHTVYVYCYSSQGGGINSYYSEIFPVKMKIYAGGMGGGLADAAAVQRIRDAFEDFLTKKHYVFKRGGCEALYDEQLVKSNKQKMAYGGNPCSNCGKTVETGWKYSSTSE